MVFRKDDIKMIEIIGGLQTTIVIFSFIGQLFNTAIISRFFLHPLAEFFYPNKSQKYFILLSIFRIIILIFLDIILLSMGPYYLFGGCVFDFLLDFIGAFIIMPILIDKIKKHNKIDISKEEEKKPIIKITCQNCGNELKITDSACSKCGTPFTGSNVKVEEITEVKK